MHETAGILILLGSIVPLLIMNAYPVLPAPPPIIELAGAFAALGTVYVLPFCLLWRRFLSRRLLTRRPLSSTLTRAGLVTAGYAFCTALAFAALFRQGEHPSAMLSAFAWAGADYAGITLLSLGSATLYSLYRRGRFRQWLSREQQRAS